MAVTKPTPYLGMRGFSASLVGSMLVLFGLGSACSADNKFVSQKPKESPKEEEIEENAKEITAAEHKPSDEPVMVSGAFLTCQEDSAITHSETHKWVGCTVLMNQKKADLSLFSEMKWSLLDGQDQPMEASFAPPTEESAYHVVTLVPKISLDEYKVTLETKIGTQSSTLVANIRTTTDTTGDSAVDETAPPPTKLKEKIVAGDFYIGDGDAPQLLNIECGVRIDTKKLLGPVIHIPFTVKADEPALSISLASVCGVNGVASYVAIHGEGSRVYKKALGIAQKQHSISQLALPAGNYTLEIASPFDPFLQQIDDLIVGKIKFGWYGEIEIGEAKVGNL